MKRDEPMIYSELIAKIVREHSYAENQLCEVFGAGRNESAVLVQPGISRSLTKFYRGIEFPTRVIWPSSESSASGAVSMTPVASVAGFAAVQLSGGNSREE